MRRKQVVVIGSSDEKQYLDEAEQIGRYIARQGWILITGGHGGVMEAASRGAYAENGLVVGILPGQNHSESNQYCSVVIPTGIGSARNSINILSGDVIVAIGGKAGTLNELTFAWLYHKPVISCVFTGGWSRQITLSPVDDRDGHIYSANSLKEVYELLALIPGDRDDTNSKVYGDT